MKPDSSSHPTPPTPSQLAEIDDALITAAELQQVYAGLLRHPRVLATPGSSDVFSSCLGQVSQDLTLLAGQAADLQTRVLPAENDDSVLDDDETLIPPPRIASFPDIEPPDPQRSVFATVRKAFHLEDFLRQQLLISLQSAHDRRHLKLELQLKMVLLSAEQRCRLLEDRYGFARTGNILFQGLRRQTTRFLNRLQGNRRADLD